MPKTSQNSKTTDLESELAGLQRRRSSLQARHDAASSAFQTAASARRTLLTEHDDPPVKDLAAADRACREAQDAMAAAADAGQEIQARLGELGARVAALQRAEQREAAAADLEAQAKAVDGIVARVVRIAADLDRARQDLAAAIPPQMAELYDPPSMAGWNGEMALLPRFFDARRHRIIETPLDPAVVASRLAGHLIITALPTLAVVDAEQAAAGHIAGQHTPVLAPLDGTTARTALSDPMRAIAGKLRKGTDRAEPKLDDVRYGERRVFVTEPCHYRDGNQQPRILSAWVHDIPAPVADILMESGLALDPDSDEGQAAVEAVRERAATRVTQGDPLDLHNTRDLGVDLEAWRHAEWQRRRAEWLADRPQIAA
ncbi:hypothetical protein [Lichenifustis flavocetrariae]|uniref:Uncharacterized protein n=1 Tax=Lichenifustis flavocetrariae TaxID=2949735 RepID=A0AA41YU55_9HYPH|nr:hypothetical protein [Lichenifustis flavocetrariae]MCW6506898.1 hypothetical protein [Lichenifustis flavocetrariae]